MPVDRKIHSWHFEPVVQIGQKVCLLTPKPKYFEVKWIEPLPYIEVSWGTVTAGSEKDKELEELYVEDDEFAQYRFAVLTSGFVVTKIACPKAVSMWVTKKSSLNIPDNSTYSGYKLVERLQTLEFYQWKDKKRYMYLKNTTSSDAEGKVAFFGYVFKIEELPSKPDVYISLPVVSRYSTGAEKE